MSNSKIEARDRKMTFEFLKVKPKPSHVELFEMLAARPDADRPLEKSLLLFCTPRCGSTLFAEALNDSGQVGICEEWFNYDYFHAYMKVTGREFHINEYLDFVTLKSIGDTGVWCVKWHIGQLIAMNQDYSLGLDSMDFDHIVYLYRRDKIAQAVSLAKAAKSNQFRSYEPKEGPSAVCRQGITAALDTIVKFDQFARGYLWKYMNDSYAYEDFQRLGSDATRPHKSYEMVLRALGKSPRFSYSAGRLKRQANHDSATAADDFRRYILGEI